MRSSLIKELHESKEYGHAGVDKIVRRLSNKVKDWQVTTETGSDHYGLLFSIQTTTELVDNLAA